MNYRDLDRRHLWHPYTRRSAAEAQAWPLIVSGEGPYLIDDQGRRYVDATASWWSCALGHSHPRLVRAIQDQAATLQHSITGNLSHPGAIELAARLAGLMPSPGRHVLFASDGSCAVEQAVKIAVQSHHNLGHPERHGFVALSDPYHGDTLGSVSVGFMDAFHRPYRNLVFPVTQVTLPAGHPLSEPADAEARFAPIAETIRARADALAGIVVEPLVQGAAGMRMYPAVYLRMLADLARETGAVLIVDEVAMGYGRTGRMFAFEHAGIDPDIVVMGKGITGGATPLSATVVKDRIYDTFTDGPDGDRTFFHGHTWSGHPIGCAAALETLRVYEEEAILEGVSERVQTLDETVQTLDGAPGVRDVRVFGLIAAIELEPGPDLRRRTDAIRDTLREQSILIRPLGPVVYLCPPLNIPMVMLQDTAEKVVRAVHRIARPPSSR